MSQPRSFASGPEALGGGLAVAAVLVALARWLPLHFDFAPNALGIVSATTRAGYPAQQEPILFLAFGSLGVLASWLAAGILGRRRFEPAAGVAFELVALAALVGALTLSPGLAAATVAALLVAMIGLVRGAQRRPPADTLPPAEPTERGPSSGPARRARFVGLALGIVALAWLRVPRLTQALQAVASRVADAQLTRNDWVFQAEDGQHLAWADALLNGGLHGRDFFCLYGPLYDWSVVGVWKLVGRSIAGWHLHVGLTELAAWIAFLSLAAWFLRRRWLLLALVVLTPHLSLRIGLPMASLLFLVHSLRSRRTRDSAAAGLLAGAGLLYSQEFGIAALFSAILVHAALRSASAAGAYAAGLLAVLVPTLGAYAAADALGPMLADLGGYPAAVMAGYGNLPFPSLLASLPWPPVLDSESMRFLRLAYLLPAVAVVGLGVSLPRLAPHPRSPAAWLRGLLDDWAARPERLAIAALSLFGLAAFRTALGRSDPFHLHACAAPSILLLAIAFDRLLDHRREAPAAVGFQAALGALVIFAGGLVTGTGAAGLFHLRNTARTLERLVAGEHRPAGNGAVNRLVRWLEDHAEPEDRFYFLPNDAAFYYLTARPSPTRFVVSHQMVSNAHRAEALASLRAAPPRYVVWNDATLRVDEVEDEVVLGPALWHWLHERYRPIARVGGARIWEYVPPAAPGGPRAAGERDQSR